MHVSVGEQVKEGDLLVEIDDEARRIALQQKKALLERAMATRKKAYRDADKGLTLFEEGVISDSESDDIQLSMQVADADLALAKADVMKAEKELRDTNFLFPSISVSSEDGIWCVSAKTTFPYSEDLFQLLLSKSVFGQE